MSPLLANLTSSADEFFHGGVLQLSNGLHEMGSLKWQLVLALFVAWIVVFGVIVKGDLTCHREIFLLTDKRLDGK